MLRQLSLQICLETFRVRLGEGDWRRDIQVVEEISDMKEDRVTSLQW